MTHRLTWHLTVGTAALHASCSCLAWEWTDGTRYSPGNPGEIKARHNVHRLGHDLDPADCIDCTDTGRITTDVEGAP